MDFAFFTRPKVGEKENGDGVGVFGPPDNKLFCVVDALGHGEEAAKVSSAIIKKVEKCWENSLEDIILSCHQDFHGSRGAALFLARFKGNSTGIAEFSGVGNIECKAICKNKQSLPFSFDGTIGLRIRKIHTFRFEFNKDEFFAIFTDGIHSNLKIENYFSINLNEAAQQIIENHSKQYDDATVLLIKT